MCRARNKVCTFGLEAQFCRSFTHFRTGSFHFFLRNRSFINAKTDVFGVMAREMHNRDSVASARLIRKLEPRVTLLFESHPREE